jgi:hypothetical protein
LEAGTAFVTQIGKVGDIVEPKFRAQLQRRKDCTIAFAVPTGVADRKLAAALLDEDVKRQREKPLDQQFDQIRCRLLGRNLQDIRPSIYSRP